MTRTLRVFAYGSNLAVARIEERVGPVAVVAAGRLDRHALRFHKVGRDGSGKADAFFTDNADDIVYGVVYEMSVAGKRALDRFEGLGSDYLEKEVTISTAVGEVRAVVYRAHRSRIDPRVVPFDWYLRLVVAGARQHHLPESYIRAIASHVSRADPDGTRADRALRLLGGG